MGGMSWQSLVLGPGVSAWKSCDLATLWEAWRREEARDSQDGLQRCTCPALRATVSSPPMRVAWPEHGLRSPVPQGNLESILQMPGGSPPRLSEGAALRAFSLYCRLSIHLQYKVCLWLGAGRGLSGPGALH